MNNTDDERPRVAAGPYTQDQASIDLDREALQLYAHRRTYRQIAEELGISLGSAYQRVKRAQTKAIVPAATEAVQQIITNLQADRAHLEAIRDQLITDYDTGCMIANPFDPELPPVQDREAALKVAEQIRKMTDQLQKIDDQTARLLGLNQPTQTQVDTTVKYEIIGVTEADLT